MDELFSGSSSGGYVETRREKCDSPLQVWKVSKITAEAFDEPPFVDVLEEEIQRRKRACLVCFNPDTLPKTLSSATIVCGSLWSAPTDTGLLRRQSHSVVVNSDGGCLRWKS